MKITSVHVDTLELTKEEPFVIASSAMAHGPCDLVRVETDEGITGIGEACPAGGRRLVDDVPAGPGLGIELIEENVELQRVERRW